MSEYREERRAYPRVDVAFDLRLDVTIRTPGSKPATGTTVNVSRGGILAMVDRRVSLRSHCVIQFEGAEAKIRISPTEVRGVVLRMTPHKSGFLIAIMFDTPLDALEVIETAWKKKRLPHRGPRDG